MAGRGGAWRVVVGRGGQWCLAEWEEKLVINKRRTKLAAQLEALSPGQPAARGRADTVVSGPSPPLPSSTASVHIVLNEPSASTFYTSLVRNCERGSGGEGCWGKGREEVRARGCPWHRGTLPAVGG